MQRNRLASETSPYLLQHADNPVDWYPWGEPALLAAKRDNKPILLSIGYSACHWCHVMAHESFEDPATAALMNELFINIKVDREERPDIDQIYQTAANAMGHAGGWPLTMFLTPQGDPYHAGAYFPKEERFGQLSFKQVLPQVARVFHEQPDPVANTAARVHQAFATLWARDLRGTIDGGTLDQCAVRIGQRFDIFYGGLTGTPKFPNAGLVELIFRAHLRTGVPQFYQLALTALEHMVLGGMYDHIGGGFSRYATDDPGMGPNFGRTRDDKPR